MKKYTFAFILAFFSLVNLHTVNASASASGISANIDIQDVYKIGKIAVLAYEIYAQTGEVVRDSNAIANDKIVDSEDSQENIDLQSYQQQVIEGLRKHPFVRNASFAGLLKMGGVEKIIKSGSIPISLITSLSLENMNSKAVSNFVYARDMRLAREVCRDAGLLACSYGWLEFDKRAGIKEYFNIEEDSKQAKLADAIVTLLMHMALKSCVIDPACDYAFDLSSQSSQ